MEKTNEKDPRAYIRPETEIVKIGGDDRIMQTINPGSGKDETEF
ncbi:MAG: hypothetical protein Q4E27_02650 [Bacteroidales bacterium]|nr:hypothetical protein [Bacteroidales bacterium]